MEQAETSIIKHIKCSDDLLPLLNYLLGSYIVDDINSIPNPIPDDYKFITADVFFSNQSSRSIVNKTNEIPYLQDIN